MESNNTPQVQHAPSPSNSSQKNDTLEQPQSSSPLQPAPLESNSCQQQYDDAQTLVSQTSSTPVLTSVSPSPAGQRTQSPPQPAQNDTHPIPSAGLGQTECNIVSPTLADILSDDRILRFYQCVKDIKLQQSPQQTSAMFFALCHALGDSVSFLKVPNMNKIMFRQEEQIFAVNVAGTSSTQSFNDTNQQQQQSPNVNMDTTISTTLSGQLTPHSSSIFLPQMTPSSDNLTTTTSATDNSAAASPYHHDHHQQQPQNANCNNHATPNTLAAAAAAAANFFSVSDQSQHLIQAALSSVGTHGTGAPAVHNAVVPQTASNTTGGVKRRGNAEKRSKKPSPRDKEYAIRRNDIIQDLLKVSEADLFHQANTVDSDVKLIIQGQERNTKLGLLSPLHRFATFANLAAHYDSDFAPKNAGVYYNYEYFQLYLAYRDLEIERTLQQQQQQQQQHGQHQPSSSTDASTASPSAVSRPVMMQCRADIEKVLVNTNWEAIRRRLTIGERICQVCGILGRGFLLLSKQVSGRKLLHNFNTGEWGEFLHEFQRPETQPLLQTLQTKFSPERLYQHQHQQHPVYSQAMSTSAAAAAAAAAMKVLPLLSQPQQSIENTSAHMTSPLENHSSATDTTTENTSTPSTTEVKASRQAPVVIPHSPDLQSPSQALSSAASLDTNVDSTTTTTSSSSSSKSLTSTSLIANEYIKSEPTTTVASSENTLEEQNENNVTADGPLDEEESRHKKLKLD
ncbi:hypothetical protein BCR42DRAFT_415533, partial [Absidia repens]